MLTQTPFDVVRRPSFLALWSAAALLLCVGGLLLSPAANAQQNSPSPLAGEGRGEGATNNVSFDIPAQDLSDALSEYARQSGQDLLYRPEQASGRAAAAVEGDMTRAEAMRRLLAGTGLQFEFHHTGSMLVGDETTLEAYRQQLNSGASVAGQNQNTIGQRRPGIEEIIVTGQKREERIQDVPIAISAFTAEDLEAQKIEGGFDLLKAVPNVTFSKTNFTGYNFQIRGIGTQAISATTDPAVAVSLNNTTLIVNRLFEQEYLDVERVEVLRGPQGTLFGRNATAGVINVISKKPEMGVWDGMFDLEVGNYNTRRLRGFVNAPIGDEFAIRAAYAETKRDGFGYNQFNNSDFDDRDLWTGRITLGWQPTDRFRANFMWERFEEDDSRVRSIKQLCHRDEGVEELNGIDVDSFNGTLGIRRQFQQGCDARHPKTNEVRSIYEDSAYSTPNGDAYPFVTGGRIGDGLGIFVGGQYGAPILGVDVPVFASTQQSRDLRSIYSAIEPQYQATSDIYEFSFDYELSDALLLSWQTVYADDELFSTQDFNRFEPSSGIFTDMSMRPPPLFGGALAPVPDNFVDGGIFCDPQLGCSNEMIIQDISQAKSEQFNQEVRLVSSFAGPVNFSLGANYTKFETRNDYFVFSNLLTAVALAPPFNGPDHPCTLTDGEEGCIFVQQGSLDEVRADPQGHNFFLSANPYELTSAGLFGELYWEPTDTVKVTLGARMSWDRKKFTPIPSQTLLADYRQGVLSDNVVIQDGDPPEECDLLLLLCGILGNAPNGRGYPANPDIVQNWREPTGRLVVDWQPRTDWSWLDETLVYASFAHGYKGGGANPPSIAPPAGIFIEGAREAAIPKTFEPEFINAYEIGTKNTLFGGGLTLNLTGFYYDYTDYQVSKIVDRSAANENFDAEVWGLELETIFAPSLNWQFNAAIGFMDSKIAQGEQSIDLMDRAQGGNRFHVTTEENPNFDPGADPVARADYVAVDEFVSGAIDGFAGGVPHYENAEGNLVPVPEGQEFLAYDEWVVMKPNPTQSSNCVVPEALAAQIAESINPSTFFTPAAISAQNTLSRLCPGGNLIGQLFLAEQGIPIPDTVSRGCMFAAICGLSYDPFSDGPNSSAGFFADVGGNELPNAPHFTVALGGQYNFDLTRDWRATARIDYYWQDESYSRVYNTEFDRLKSWSNTNLSFWVANANNGITVEAYVKNLFDETPITGTFLNSDDTGLSNNVFTLDPRLIGVSVRKEF